VISVAGFHINFGLLISIRNEFYKILIPLSNKLTIFNCSNKIIFHSLMPLGLGVGILIDCPIK